MKQFRVFFSIVFLMATTILFAQETEKKPRNWSLNGYVKYMQTASFTQIDEQWLTDNLIHNRLKFNWNVNDHFTFNAQMRNRVYYGETVSFFQQYSDIINVENGFMDLSFLVFEGKSVFMQSNFDRLYLDYNFDMFQITIGRQRINWGQTFAWNPNDLFNSYSFFDFDYEEKPGTDAVRLQIYPSYASKVDLVFKLNHEKKITAAGLYRFNLWAYDFQFLGGYFEERDIVLGAGFSGSLFKGGFRGEISYFQPKDEMGDTTSTLVASLGYDYTFTNSLMIQFEALYNGYGNKYGEFNLQEFYFLQMSPQNLSITEYSFLTQLSYPISPLFNATISAMYSPNNESTYFGPSLDYSLKDNLELSMYSQFFTSNTNAEAGGKGAFLYWRLKWSF